jgi:hypothetical protein
MANSVAPTVGTVVAFAGGLVGLGVHNATGGGQGGSAVTLLAAGGCYLIAGAIGATMRRDLLGPPPLAEGEQRRGVLAELTIVVKGLVSGAQHVWQRRPVAAALGATGSQRMMYGILLLTSILLYRNYFYASSGANASLAHFTLVVIAAAIGYGAAAVVTPIVTRWLSKAAWIAVLLCLGGVVTGVLAPTFAQPSFLAISLALGLVAQGVAICTTTIIQQRMDDGYRRVRALRHAVQRPVRARHAGRRPDHPGQRQVPPADHRRVRGYLLAAAKVRGGRPPGRWPGHPRRAARRRVLPGGLPQAVGRRRASSPGGPSIPAGPPAARSSGHSGPSASAQRRNPERPAGPQRPVPHAPSPAGAGTPPTTGP